MAKRVQAFVPGALALIALCYLGAHFWVIRSRVSHRPYDTSAQILGDIRRLPLIGLSAKQPSWADWSRYVSVAKRIRATKPDLSIAAFHDLTAPSGPLAGDLRDAIRGLILLRVCFECPPGKLSNNVSGGWMSDSAAEAGRFIPLDCNWPVAYRFGRFHLVDTVNGYHAFHTYDAGAEFEWMLYNCRWR